MITYYDACKFTTREIEIVKLIAKGFGYKEMSRNLFIEASTVKTHIDSLYQKTGLSKSREHATMRVNLIREALKIGLISINDLLID